jgi:hypothetical protein
MPDDAETYRRAQAIEMFLRFEDAHGREPLSDAEFHAWAKEQVARWEKPIKPRAAAYEQ